MDEFSERTINREFLDIIGVVNPQNSITNPTQAAEAATTMRRIAGFIKAASWHLGACGAEPDEDFVLTMGDLADCIHVGAGHLLEYLEGQRVREQQDLGAARRPKVVGRAAG